MVKSSARVLLDVSRSSASTQAIGPDTLQGSGPLPPPTQDEIDLERRIRQAAWALVYVSGELNRRYYARKLPRLVAQRSPAQIARMERDLGLTR